VERPLSIEELRRRIERLPRVPLTHLPTPFREVPRLAEAVGNQVRLFVKRDDLTTLGFGGNKTRKLEFSLGELKEQGCDVIVHGLAGQSNYCRQTAAAAARLGLPCYLVLRNDHKAGDPAQGNRLLDYVFGADVRMVESDRQAETKAALIEELKSNGHRPYVVGRRDEVLGAAAYCLCLAEIMEQQRQAEVSADYVCVTGSSGTMAGLVLGKRLLGFDGEILGFYPAPCSDEGTLRQHTAELATDAAPLLGADEQFTAEDIRNTASYGGEAYGSPTDACLDALLLAGRTEGMVFGPVYTAKGMAGVIDFVRTGRIGAGSTVIFLHTGGSPEPFCYNAEIMRRLGETT
jgi:1-aminocyclopropane-1-carboxylate deaminase/D-cysteine desulfhydrase-like pyridoxal-dependent ACC family enzyme